MIRRFPTESQSSARARRQGRAANDMAVFVFCFSSPRLGARAPPFARKDAPLPLNPLFVFVGDGGMKGWRHLRVDQQIPPREKNETGVYDGRHIFLCGFRLFSKKLTDDSRARRVLLLTQATNSTRCGRSSACISRRSRPSARVVKHSYSVAFGRGAECRPVETRFALFTFPRV